MEVWNRRQPTSSWMRSWGPRGSVIHGTVGRGYRKHEEWNILAPNVPPRPRASVPPGPTAPLRHRQLPPDVTAHCNPSCDCQVVPLNVGPTWHSGTQQERSAATRLSRSRAQAHGTFQRRLPGTQKGRRRPKGSDRTGGVGGPTPHAAT
jgi:hypothetical protein